MPPDATALRPTILQKVRSPSEAHADYATTPVLRKVFNGTEHRYVSPCDVAMAFGGVGDDDEPLQWLDPAR